MPRGIVWAISHTHLPKGPLNPIAYEFKVWFKIYNFVKQTHDMSSTHSKVIPHNRNTRTKYLLKENYKWTQFLWTSQPRNPWKPPPSLSQNKSQGKKTHEKTREFRSNHGHGHTHHKIAMNAMLHNNFFSLLLPKPLKHICSQSIISRGKTHYSSCKPNNLRQRKLVILRCKEKCEQDSQLGQLAQHNQANIQWKITEAGRHFWSMSSALILPHAKVYTVALIFTLKNDKDG